MKRIERCLAVAFAVAFAAWSPCAAKGVLCLTFDDRNFDAWERNIPLFAKYGAHATFFVSGKIDERAEKCMRRLSAEGHCIGLHGFRHQRARLALSKLGEEGYIREEILPQLSVCREKGLDVRSFAYPYRDRSSETDAILLRHFDCLRPDSALCCTHPRDAPDKIAKIMPSIAASNQVMIVYAHGIEAKGEKHDPHNITEEDLEKILSSAMAAGVAMTRISSTRKNGGNEQWR